MKEPIDTLHNSVIEYPSSVFSLERHEIYPYDRYAYNTLCIATEALHAKKLPEAILVSFLQGMDDKTWWSFNAGIETWESPHGGVTGFKISTTPLTPLLLFAVCYRFGEILFSNGSPTNRTASAFTDVIQKLGKDFSETLKICRAKGLASAIRFLATATPFEIWKLPDVSNRYDLCAQFIANHEVAHAYVGQLAEKIRPLHDSEHRAFELIVDLLATQWGYRRMIVNTPDTKEYRDFRGTQTHRDSIYLNVILSIQVQILNFLSFAFASALMNRGKITLDGGNFHPHSFMRYLFQDVYLFTLVASNFANLLGEESLREIEQYAKQFIRLFMEIGLFSFEDVQKLESLSTAEDCKHAHALVEEFQIHEFDKSREIFRTAAEFPKRAAKHLISG